MMAKCVIYFFIIYIYNTLWFALEMKRHKRAQEIKTTKKKQTKPFQPKSLAIDGREKKKKNKIERSQQCENKDSKILRKKNTSYFSTLQD